MHAPSSVRRRFESYWSRWRYNNMPYFMIDCTEDGVYVTEVTSDTIKSDMRTLEAAAVNTFFKPGEKFDSDPNYWGTKTLLIKGEVVVPRPKDTVTEWDIP